MNKLKDNWSYIKHFKMNSIFLRTFLLVALLTIVPFLIMSILFYSTNFRNVREEITLENSSTLDSSVNIIDRTLMECDMMSSSLASNESTQLFTINNVSTDSFKTVTGLAKTLPMIYTYLDSIYIYSEPADSLIVSENIQPISDYADTDWLDDYKKINSPTGIIIPRSKNNSYPPLITIIKPIYVADEKTGAIIMNINSQIMYNSMLYKRYKDGKTLLLLNPDNKIIMSSNSEYFNVQLEDICLNSENIGSDTESCQINDENYTVLSAESRVSSYKYISAYPLTLYEQRLSAMRVQIIVILLLLLAVVFVLAYVASAKSYTPLHEIISFLDSSPAAADNISNEDKNELTYIINSIRLHIEDKTKMEEILEERMKLLRKAQYDMLQTQINPHFLYNTLETINWMAYNLSNSENPVSKSLITLASFFRNTLSSGYFVSIKDEIKYTKEYISILALRYSDLFDIEWNIDNAILPCTIIKICLQPIIENAVYHGLKPKNNKGLIKISGKCDDKNILITVSDNGIGMDSETLNSLNHRLQDNAYNDEKSHIGLINVNQRIKIIFGDNYGITVTSREGLGTDVYITIPLKQ